MRLFLAIDFNEEIKRYCKNIQERLQPSTIHGNYTNYHNFHITLKYIGQSTEQDYNDLVDILETVSKDFNPFTITLKGLQSFSRGRKHILWVGVDDKHRILHKLYKEVEKRTTDIGFEPDIRPYTPHLTVARNVSFHQTASSYSILAQAKRYEVNSLVLMKSHRVNGVLSYTPLHRVTL